MQNLLKLTEKIENFALLMKSQSVDVPLSFSGSKYSYEIKTSEQWQRDLKREDEENRLLRVGFIGRVKAGKSSLLNALLFDGRDVLPKAATPMTAALTSIKYGESLKAKVIFYSKEDIQHIEKKAKEYKTLLDNETKRQQSALEERQKISRKKLTPTELAERAVKMATRELKDNPNTACYDQYQRMQDAKLDLSQESQDIFATTVDELMGKLTHYVGAEGKYMPYTREVELYLPEENLKDLEIVDTPGVNDPISSREERTTAFLKECDAVFMISPSAKCLKN